MGAYLGLRDGWFRENEVILDAIETLQGQADGAFYPTEHGPKGHTGAACPDLWGYLDLKSGHSLCSTNRHAGTRV